MNLDHSRITLLRRAALFCALLVILIVGISAFIRLSSAGLGCSPWPQCYGQTLRDEQQGVTRIGDTQTNKSVSVARFAHRFLAVLLLPFVLVLVIAGFAMRPHRWNERWVSVLALALVLFLAILGRWTAGSRLPAVTLGNLFGGFLLFALCWRMAVFGRSQVVGHLLSRHARVWQGVAVAVLLFQIALGGLLSSSFAGLSCPDMMDCLMTKHADWDALNPMCKPHFNQGNLTENAGGALAQVMHLGAAIATALAVIGVAIVVLRSGRRMTGSILLLLLGAQVTLGFLLVRNGLPLAAAVAHNLVAALLLASLLAID